MKHKESIHFITATTLERVKQEYGDLLRGTSISLEKLFAPENFRFEEFCKEFSPHPKSDELKRIAHAFGEKSGIWLPNAKHHITCALFLYPTAHFERMLTMMKNLTLGFYLNDVIGRDTFKFLPVEQKIKAKKMIKRMSELKEALEIPSDANPLEFVNVEILSEFKNNSPKEWFAHFLKLYCYHIGITHADGNAAAQGRIPDIFEYMERRCHLGGVHHILLWIEYSDASFLEWGLLKTLNIEHSLRRLHWVTAAFAGLSNDLFSFEKEVIDNGSDSNLVMIIALNYPKLPLKDAILKASEIVRNLLLELITLISSITREIKKTPKFIPLMQL